MPEVTVTTSGRRRQPEGIQLRHVGDGHYRTPDGRYSIFRVGSMDEWDGETPCWTLCHGSDQEAEILDRPTKRECVEALAAMLAKETS